MEQPTEAIDYRRLVSEALRDVPRRALAHVAEEGMPGDHHFYISFRSSDPEVEIPDFLRDQYPEETTIILQHQFWSLAVDDDAFSVVLSFGGRRHRLFIPFAALTAFADPSSAFTLRFDALPASEDLPEELAAGPSEEVELKGPAEGPEKGGVLRFDPSRRR